MDSSNLAFQSYPLGATIPLGATVTPHGVNFSLFSKNSRAVVLHLFDDVDDAEPSHTILLSPVWNKTLYYWHIFVPDIKAGQLYGYRAYGPNYPEQGLRYDGSKLLLDPYARAIAVGKNYSRRAAMLPGDNTAYAAKSVVVDPSQYDWEGDTPLNIPFNRTIIYELHVGGFTRHPSSGIDPQKRGTYAGLIEKIPYLQELGITAVELLPVLQFDEQDGPGNLQNYWGYSPLSFFAPHQGYSSRKDPIGPVDEFRDMVKALHRVGIEVILDVVYNHTAEGNHLGPTFSFKGLENKSYYILESNKAHYANYSGSGNTMNANRSVVRRMVLDSLHYWVSEMHVDGFRFDLASVLSRDSSGQPLEDPPLLWSIETDPVLARTKIIAEAWDAAGLYQVGSFIGDRWSEWNGQFRDDTRRFFRGDKGMVSKVAARFLGSPDIYQHGGYHPHRSINFITSHDGFTLVDLVSYNHKHNEANYENDKDGTDENFSWNCGIEGPSDDPHITMLRSRQVKNFLTFLLLSFGTPMILMGDEIRRTQSGNNNAYCQDNEMSWLNWHMIQVHKDLFQFVKKLLDLKRHYYDLSLKPKDHVWSLTDILEETQVQWHGVSLGAPDWSFDSRTLAFTIRNIESSKAFHFMLNAFHEALHFQVPQPSAPASPWLRIIDTALASPDDCLEPPQALQVKDQNYTVEAFSTVVLFSYLDAHA